MPMNLNKNLGKRKEGAKKVLDRIRNEAEIDENKLIWVDPLNSYGPKYRLRVFVGDGQQDFVFTDEDLSDYPLDRPHPIVDSTIDAIIDWIKNQTIRLPRQ